MGTVGEGQGHGVTRGRFRMTLPGPTRDCFPIVRCFLKHRRRSSPVARPSGGSLSPPLGDVHGSELQLLGAQSWPITPALCPGAAAARPRARTCAVLAWSLASRACPVRHPGTGSWPARAGAWPARAGCAGGLGEGTAVAHRGPAATSPSSAMLIVPGEARAGTRAGPAGARPRFYGSASYA